jgi:hypothetical protein
VKRCDARVAALGTAREMARSQQSRSPAPARKGISFRDLGQPTSRDHDGTHAVHGTANAYVPFNTTLGREYVWTPSMVTALIVTLVPEAKPWMGTVSELLPFT